MLRGDARGDCGAPCSGTRDRSREEASRPPLQPRCQSGARRDDRRALELVFPQQGIERTRFAERAAPHRPIEPGAVIVPKKGKSPALELRTGDLVGFEVEGHWLAGVVLGIHSAENRVRPVLEFFDHPFASRPDARGLAEAKARTVGPYREAPHSRREPLALEGLELLGPVMGVRMERLARDHAPPSSGGAPATHFRSVASRNLLHLLAGSLG